MNDLRGERLQVMLSPEELTALGDFRFKHRMPTRAAAVRELLKLGLTVTTTDANAALKSSNYGVFNRGPAGHGRENSGRTAPLRVAPRLGATWGTEMPSNPRLIRSLPQRLSSNFNSLCRVFEPFR